MGESLSGEWVGGVVERWGGGFIEREGEQNC